MTAHGVLNRESLVNDICDDLASGSFGRKIGQQESVAALTAQTDPMERTARNSYKTSSRGGGEASNGKIAASCAQQGTDRTSSPRIP